MFHFKSFSPCFSFISQGFTHSQMPGTALQFVAYPIHLKCSWVFANKPAFVITYFHKKFTHIPIFLTGFLAAFVAMTVLFSLLLLILCFRCCRRRFCRPQNNLTVYNDLLKDARLLDKQDYDSDGQNSQQTILGRRIKRVSFSLFMWGELDNIWNFLSSYVSLLRNIADDNRRLSFPRCEGEQSPVPSQRPYH